MSIEVEELRISKLRDYLTNVVEEVGNNRGINANALGKEIDIYSLDKIPTASTVEKWITGIEKHKDVFSFRSRKGYSYDVINNMKNIGFFEKLEDTIRTKNEKREFPEIDGIESIECLNCGTLNGAEQSTATFDIQIQITYIVE